jgi:hypothetical protein
MFIQEILTSFDRLNFLDSLWLFAIALIFHVAEEWRNLANWFDKNFISSSPTTHQSIQLGLLFGSTTIVIWCTLAFLTQNSKIAALVIFPALMLILSHSFEHIFWGFYFQQYSPGMITAIFLLIPTIAYLIFKAIQQDSVPIWYAIAFIILGAVNFIQTVKLKNNPPPAIRILNNLGFVISKKLENLS